MKGLLVTITIIILTGCTNKGGKFSGILPKEKMESVMWDIIRADVFTEQFIKKDSSKNAPAENLKLQNKIFSIHQVSREDFYKSYDYYSSHTDQMRTILDSITVKGDRERHKMVEHQMGRYNQQAIDSNYAWEKTIHY